MWTCNLGLSYCLVSCLEWSTGLRLWPEYCLTLWHLCSRCLKVSQWHLSTERKQSDSCLKNFLLDGSHRKSSIANGRMPPLPYPCVDPKWDGELPMPYLSLHISLVAKSYWTYCGEKMSTWTATLHLGHRHGRVGGELCCFLLIQLSGNTNEHKCKETFSYTKLKLDLVCS